MGLQRVKSWARELKRQLMVLWFCYRHPDVPWLPKIMAIMVVGYAFSPIDLIPDFIPGLGMLDDVLLLPLGIWLCLRLIPQPIIEESRHQAEQWMLENADKPVNRLAGLIIALIWLLLAAGAIYLFRHRGSA